MPNKYLDSVQLGRLITKIKSLVSTTVAGYLPLSGGSINGNLSVSGTITGDVTGTASGNLPLSGGTMTGTLTIGTDAKARGLMSPNGTSCFRIASGEFTYANAGAFIHLFSNTADTNAGNFQISAHTSSAEKALVGKSDGTLTWAGNGIVTTNTVETFSGSSTYNANGYKIGRLCVVYFRLPTGFASGWHTTEEIISTNLPISGSPITVGNVSGQGDAGTQIRLRLSTAGKLDGYISAQLNNPVYCSCIYISAS